MRRVLGVIVAVGFAHRLLFLGKRQLWTEELMQAFITRSSSAGELLHHLKQGMYFPAPIDYFVQMATTLVLGDSPWALRLHAVAFGTLSIWFFYRIACRLFGPRIAVYSAFLFAFFPLEYHYSQEARPPALFLFLTLVSYDVLLRWIEGGMRRWSGGLLQCLSLVLLMYQSFLGLLVAMSQLIGLLAIAPSGAEGADARGPAPAAADGGMEIAAIRPSRIARYLPAAFVAVLLFLPWIRFAWAKPMAAQPSEILDPRLILRMIKEVGDNSYAVAGLILAGAATGIRALLRHGRRRTLWWLLAWMLPSIPVLLVLEYWSGYFFSIGQILHLTPPLLLLSGYGLSYIGERMTILDRLPYRLSAPALVFAALLCVMAVWISAVHWGRELADWRGTARFLASMARPGDAISMPVVYNLLEYYSPGLETYRVSDLDPGPGLLAGGAAERRIVVCYDDMTPDPCRAFRAAADEGKSWGRLTSYRGFTIFVRPVRSDQP
jgi:uncharacterized membrane protein